MSDARGGERNARLFAFFGYAAAAIAVLVPLLITLDRFRRPTGDKFVFPWLGGSADLWLPYNGARALLAHIDPYMTPLPPELRDPSGWPSTYPPTMLLLYVPLVLATNSDVELACQVFYWLNILALGLFTYSVWRLTLALRGDPQQDALGTLLIVLFALTLNSATMFALDRGQSEIINAALCWTAVLLATQKRFAFAMALVTLAAAIKGYAAFLAMGLLLTAPTRKHFVRGLVSALVVTAAVTLPVASHLGKGLAAMQTRSAFFFTPVWYNHSYKSLFHHITPEGSDDARYAMLALTAVIMVLAGWRLSVAARRGDEPAVRARVVLFASAALALMVGMPVYSGIYNYLLVLPGLLLLASHVQSFARSTGARVALGVSAPLALAFGLMMHRIGSEVPLAGIALVYLVLVAGLLSVLGTPSTVQTSTARLREADAPGS
jgi:hypothetical protein